MSALAVEDIGPVFLLTVWGLGVDRLVAKVLTALCWSGPTPFAVPYEPLTEPRS